MKTIFEFRNYKKYLNEYITDLPNKGRGEKKKLASTLNCQTTFISQVLKSTYHFSVEQGDKISIHIGHNQDERKFFRILILFTRTSNKEFKKALMLEINEILEKQHNISKRINIPKGLQEKDQHIYYSTWYYAAIHIMTTIPEYQTLDKIYKTLNIDKETTINALNFLINTGLVQKKGAKYIVGKMHIHLPQDSIQIKRHHANWRNRAINSIDLNLKEDLHYSVVASLSKKDVPIIKEKILKSLKEILKTINKSNEEQLQCLTFDFFKL